MNEFEAFEVIKKQLCKEVCQMAEQIQKNNTMSTQDLEKLDKIYHLKKSMLTVRAMEDSEQYIEENQNGNGMSGYRGRSPMTGRYVSRSSDAYSDGYSRGYSEAMGQMHNPYNEPRRW